MDDVLSPQLPKMFNQTTRLVGYVLLKSVGYCRQFTCDFNDFSVSSTYVWNCACVIYRKWVGIKLLSSLYVCLKSCHDKREWCSKQTFRRMRGPFNGDCWSKLEGYPMKQDITRAVIGGTAENYWALVSRMLLSGQCSQTRAKRRQPESVSCKWHKSLVSSLGALK